MSERAEKRLKGRGRHTEQFKRRAVGMMQSRSMTLKELSRELNVSVVSLIKWRRDLQQPSAQPSAAKRSADDVKSGLSEIDQLRLELAKVTEERDRLRRGIALLVGAI
jgi:transposase-like protein